MERLAAPSHEEDMTLRDALVGCWSGEAIGMLKFLVDVGAKVLSPLILLPLHYICEHETAERFEREAFSTPIGAGGTVVECIDAVSRAGQMVDAAVASLRVKLCPETVRMVAEGLATLRNALGLLPTSPVIP